MALTTAEQDSPPMAAPQPAQAAPAPQAVATEPPPAQAASVPGAETPNAFPSHVAHRDADLVLGKGEKGDNIAKAADDYNRTGSISGLPASTKPTDVVEANKAAVEGAQMEHARSQPMPSAEATLSAPAAETPATPKFDLAALKDAVNGVTGKISAMAGEMMASAQSVPPVDLGTNTPPPHAPAAPAQQQGAAIA